MDNKTDLHEKLRKGTGIFLIVVVALFFLAMAGQSAKLTCERSQPSGTINCVKQSRLLWVIPLGTKSIRSVQGAKVTESSTSEGDAVYRVELLTAQGTIPLNAMYTSGYSTKKDVAAEINTFVKQTSKNTLVVTEPGLLSLENLICMAIWFPIAWSLNIIWRSIKSAFGRAKDRTTNAV